MASRQVLNALAAIERHRSVDILLHLLEDLDLPEYTGGDPRVRAAGTTPDSLGRAMKDVSADGDFALSILVGALSQVVADQDRRIGELEAQLPSRSAKKAS